MYERGLWVFDVITSNSERVLPNGATLCSFNSLLKSCIESDLSEVIHTGTRNGIQRSLLCTAFRPLNDQYLRHQLPTQLSKRR